MVDSQIDNRRDVRDDENWAAGGDEALELSGDWGRVWGFGVTIRMQCATIVAAALFAPARTDSPRVWTWFSPVLIYNSPV